MNVAQKQFHFAIRAITLYPMLRTQLVAALMMIGLVITGGAVLTFWSMDRARDQVLRSEAQDKTLGSYIELNALNEQLLRAIAEAAFARGISVAKAEDLRAQIVGKIKAVKEDILNEAAGLSTSDKALEAEQKELVAISAVEHHLRDGLAVLDLVIRQSIRPQAAWLNANQLLGDVTDFGVRARMERLIRDERLQVGKANLAADATIGKLRRWAFTYGIICFLLLCAIGYYFYGRIRSPFNALMHATRTMAQGDVQARVAVTGADEFAAIAANVNAIAQERQDHHALLLAQQEKLESLVVQRTEELRVAMERINTADKLRRDLFADISHELRTPLTALRGEAEIAARRANESSEFYRTALRRVIDLSTQLARLIDDLLFVSRTDAGSHRMQINTLELRPLLQSVCTEAKALAAGQNIDADIALSPGDANVMVFGDYDRLHQLFMILVDNAINYSGDTVDVRLAYSVEDVWVTITVADRGVGIPEAEIASIFLRFQRGTGANTRRREGLGLGLPIAKAIVDAHGGAIHIDSKPDSGTTVRVTLRVTNRLRAVA